MQNKEFNDVHAYIKEYSIHKWRKEKEFHFILLKTTTLLQFKANLKKDSPN